MPEKSWSPKIQWAAYTAIVALALILTLLLLPGVWRVFQGFLVGAGSWTANSVVSVFPRTTAPASLRVLTTTESWSGTKLEKRLPKNLAGVARDLRRNLKDFQRQIDKARMEREDRWNRIEAQIRRDAARVLRRLEKAVEPRSSAPKRKKAVRKKATSGKVAPKKAEDA